MNDISSLTTSISALRTETQEGSITPERLGAMLQRLANLLAACATDAQLSSVQGTSNNAATKSELDDLKNIALVNIAGRVDRTGNAVNIVLTLTEGDDDTSTLTMALPLASATAAGVVSAADYKKVSEAIANMGAGSSSASSGSGMTEAERNKLNTLAETAACWSQVAFTAGESEKKKKYKIWLTLHQAVGSSSAEYDVDIPIATAANMGVMSTEQVALLNKSLKDFRFFIEESGDDFLNIELTGTTNDGNSSLIGSQLRLEKASDEFAGLMSVYDWNKVDEAVTNRVLDLGTFSMSQMAEDKASEPAIAGNRALGVLTYKVQGSTVNGTGIIIQRVRDMDTIQRLYWNGVMYERTITFKDSSHSRVEEESQWTSLASYTKQGTVRTRQLILPDYFTGLFHTYSLPYANDQTLGMVYLRSQRVDEDADCDDSTYECAYINRLEDRIAALEARLS